MPSLDRRALAARRRAMLKLYAQGLTHKEISERYAMTKQGVHRFLSAALTPEIRAQHHAARQAAESRQNLRELERRNPRFLALIAAGATKDTIRQQLRLTDAQLKWLFNQLNQSEWKRWRSAAYIRIDIEKKLAILRHAASLVDGPLTMPAYEQLRQSHPDWPSAVAFRAREKWSWWLRQAGLPVGAQPQRRPRYSQAQCSAAVARVYRLLGRIMSKTEYEQHRRSCDPSVGAICYRGKGRWPAALELLLPEAFECCTP